MAADDHAKEGAKKSEPPEQMMIQNAQMAAVHILDIAPEATFGGDARGGGEGRRKQRCCIKQENK